MIVIIADDLTGANDTAIQYRRCGISSLVSVGLAQNDIDQKINDYELISVNTDTRALSAEAAYKAVYDTCKKFCTSSDTYIYKKIDSVLRGNPGSELDGVMDALNVSIAFVAPSFPENDRSVKDGILYYGKDCADVCWIFNSEMKRKNILVPLKIVRQGKEACFTFINDKINSEHAEVFIFDSETDADLLVVKETSLLFKERVVLCGSAGLAKADAGILSLSHQKKSATTVKESDGIFIVLTSSRNGETKKQVLSSSQELDIPYIILDKQLIYEGKEEQAVEEVVSKAGEQITKGCSTLILCLSSLFEDFKLVQVESEESYKKAYRLSECLAQAVCNLFNKFQIRGFVSCGGDTTMQLCRKLGSYGIEPLCEIQKGVPAGIFIGGLSDSLPVITKSGGFGDQRVLTDAVKFLMEKKYKEYLSER